jgi:hypothetical protein
VKVILALLVAAITAVPAPASAQTEEPKISLRPFFVVTAQRYSAIDTFQAVFGSPVQPAWGGGLQLAFRRGVYVDVTASRFQKTGQRAFFLDGQGYPLGIPLKVTVTPFEVTVGGKGRVSENTSVYIGGGAGSYAYTEESDDAADVSGVFRARHVGYLAVLGVEVHVSSFVSVAGDMQYARVPGVLGIGGVSKEAGDTDLGGIAGRIRVIVGR